MAKGYRAKHDVSFPRIVARVSDDDWAAEGTNYTAGSIIPHDSLPPHVQKRIENGELDDTLDPMDDDEYESEASYSEGGEPEFGVFVAEHEAEAHALRMAGHHVIPKSQVLESLSAGQEHAARYQDAVREHGMDRRPMQEAMAKAEGDEGRVPGHLLEGLETRSGIPHNRGPQAREHEVDEAEDQSEEESASRPHPGTEGQGEGQ